MHILIDRRRLCVVYRHPNAAVVRNLGHIELPHTETFVLDQTSLLDKDILSIGELLLLYESMTGNKGQTVQWQALGKLVYAACETLPISDVNAFEVMTQALAISMEDGGSYRYTKGRGTPTALAEIYEPPALKGLLQSTPILDPAPAVLSPASAPVALAAAPVVQKVPPKYPPPWA